MISRGYVIGLVTSLAIGTLPIQLAVPVQAQSATAPATQARPAPVPGRSAAAAPAVAAQAPAADSVDTLKVEQHDPSRPAPPQEITVRTWTDRPALWVGERVLFTIEIQCAPSVDVVSADLAGEKLSLTGLDLIDSALERTSGSDGRTTTRVVYRLTTYEPGAGMRQIGDLTVRYGKRRAGQRMDESTPAGELVVPGTAVALRSALPDEVKTIDVRDRRPLRPVPALLVWARPIGLALILLSAAPVLLWAGAFLARLRTKTRRRDTRAARQDTRTTLAELAQTDFTTDAARRDAYTRLSAALNAHVAQVSGIPAQALTSAEILPRLAAAKSTLPADAIAALLEECEHARYAPPHVVPPAARARDAVMRADEMIAGTR